MKVNYLPKNRFKHPYFKRIVILVVIFISGAVAFSLFDAVVMSIVSPIWEVTRREVLPPSNEQTQKNILLELVGRKQESDTVIATVLTRPPQTPYDVIVIDAGSNESVSVGSEVSLPEGPILGVVSDVYSKRAKVKLFSASGEETSAVLERNNMPVILVGTGGGNFKLTLPRDMTVEKGDRILSADIAPRHLATVGEINVQPTDSFKEVLARSPTNIFTLRFVFITP